MTNVLHDLLGSTGVTEEQYCEADEADVVLVVQLPESGVDPGVGPRIGPGIGPGVGVDGHPLGTAAGQLVVKDVRHVSWTRRRSWWFTRRNRLSGKLTP